MKSAKPQRFRSSGREIVVPFRRVNATARGAGLPAGGARDRGDAAIADRPHHRWSTIIVLFCAALLWAWWGTIDIVASATGKIMPSGRTKIIQPFETGVVRAIRVQDGQAVKAGDVLIELDPTVNAAERDHLQNDLLAEQLNVARLRAALAAGDDHAADFTPPAGADPDPGQHPAPAVAEPGHRASRQDRSTVAAAGAEGSRTRHDRAPPFTSSRR